MKKMILTRMTVNDHELIMNCLRLVPKCLPHMKPTIILETSYKDVGNMMWWGFRNAPKPNEIEN